MQLKRIPVAALATMAIGGLVLSACATRAAAPPPAPAPPPETVVGVATKADIGGYLVDAKGMTLYTTTLDSTVSSNLTGDILKDWPIFYTKDIVVPRSLNISLFTDMMKSDGRTFQTCYSGRPLYYSVKDQAPGDTAGDGVEAGGGKWFVVKVPFYSVMLQTKAGWGTYLVDGRGITLYYAKTDEVGKSNVTGDALNNWFLFNAKDFTVPSALDAADFATIKRPDGQSQTTYRGWPLYFPYLTATTRLSYDDTWFIVNPDKFPPKP